MFWMVRVTTGEIQWLDSDHMIMCLYRAITCSCRDLFAGVIPSMSCDLVTGKRNIRHGTRPSLDCICSILRKPTVHMWTGPGRHPRSDVDNRLDTVLIRWFIVTAVIVASGAHQSQRRNSTLTCPWSNALLGQVPMRDPLNTAS
jgi:hypothetical protein